MPALKIIGCVILVVVLILLVRVGCRVDFSAEGLELELKIACFRIRILPAAEKKKPKKKKKSKKKKKKKKPEKKKKSLGELKWLLELISPALNALQGLRRKLRIDHLKVDYCIGGVNDPADAAMKYGIVSSGGGALFPLINAVFDVRDWDLNIGVDFMAEKTCVALRAQATYRIGQLLGIVLQLGWRALCVYAKHQKELKVKKSEEVKQNGTETSDQ